jgi:hypothetical protein
MKLSQGDRAEPTGAVPSLRRFFVSRCFNNLQAIRGAKQGAIGRDLAPVLSRAAMNLLPSRLPLKSHSIRTSGVRSTASQRIVSIAGSERTSGVRSTASQRIVSIAGSGRTSGVRSTASQRIVSIAGSERTSGVRSTASQRIVSIAGSGRTSGVPPYIFQRPSSRCLFNLSDTVDSRF